MAVSVSASALAGKRVEQNEWGSPVQCHYGRSAQNPLPVSQHGGQDSGHGQRRPLQWITLLPASSTPTPRPTRAS